MWQKTGSRRTNSFSNPIDVLLLDLQLPGRNGIEILKEVKNNFLY